MKIEVREEQYSAASLEAASGRFIDSLSVRLVENPGRSTTVEFSFPKGDSPFKREEKVGAFFNEALACEIRATLVRREGQAFAKGPGSAIGSVLRTEPDRFLETMEPQVEEDRKREIERLKRLALENPDAPG